MAPDAHEMSLRMQIVCDHSTLTQWIGGGWAADRRGLWRIAGNPVRTRVVLDEASRFLAAEPAASSERGGIGEETFVDEVRYMDADKMWCRARESKEAGGSAPSRLRWPEPVVWWVLVERANARAALRAGALVER